jgi:tetratricopeptide (TPR) repeat protein
MLGIRLLLLVTIASIAAAEKLPKPGRIPIPPTPEQTALIKEGIGFHDRGEFESAVRKYKQVLAENPWEVTALHELAFSYFVSKNYQEALSTAREGAQCKSNLLPRFYMMMGNALDELGKGEEAIQTYRAVIKQNPGVALLHYNLAVSLRRAGKQSEAKAALQNSLHLDPSHASSHVLLAGIYRDLGYRVPAILAYSRFLELEPSTPRGGQVFPNLQKLLTAGVARGEGPTKILVTVSDSKATKGEGDFAAAELMISMLLAADMMIEKSPEATKKPGSPFEKLVSIYSSLAEALKNSKPKGGFAADYYAPYFVALAGAGHTEALVAKAWKAAKIQGADDWEQANAAKIEEHNRWSKAFPWAAK